MNCSARDGRPSLSIPPGVCPAHALLFLHEGAAAIVGGMDRKGFIRHRGFWLLALLWLPEGLAPGLPSGRLVGGHRARRGYGGGVAVGGAAGAAGDRGLRGGDQPAGLDCLVVAGAPELRTDAAS